MIFCIQWIFGYKKYLNIQLYVLVSGVIFIIPNGWSPRFLLGVYSPEISLMFTFTTSLPKPTRNPKKVFIILWPNQINVGFNVFQFYISIRYPEDTSGYLWFIGYMIYYIFEYVQWLNGDSPSAGLHRLIPLRAWQNAIVVGVDAIKLILEKMGSI